MDDPKEEVWTTLASTELSLADKVEEHVVWNDRFEPQLAWLPDNLQRICSYGFMEILNNAIEHSDGKKTFAWVSTSEGKIRIVISDDGIGIFEKIKSHFGLQDYQHAILELAKGKLTTDRTHHTGEDIFFASRMFDVFTIRSNHFGFWHDSDGDWFFEMEPKQDPGTRVNMEIATDSKRTTKEVFDMFTDPDSDDYSFSKTHVPLKLARHGSQELISRSEARRVLSRFDGFKEVFLDFAGIEWIGQAFADEIFRVFKRAHPNIEVIAVNAGEPVRQMIARALAQPVFPPEKSEAGTEMNRGTSPATPKTEGNRERPSKETQIMARKLGGMAIGDEGFCSTEALYTTKRLSTMGPNAGHPEPNLGRPGTSTFLDPRFDFFPERSSEADLHVSMRDDGFVIRWPPDRPKVIRAILAGDQPRPILPVIATNPEQPE